jgi:hypothetical protein
VVVGAINNYIKMHIKIIVENNIITMKKIVYTLFISLTLLYSCKEKTKPDSFLTEDDKAWNIYHVGDSLKFLSNINHKRNYIVIKVEQGMRDKPYDGIKYEYIYMQASRTDTILTGIVTGLEMTFARDQNDSRPGLAIFCGVDGFEYYYPFNLLKGEKIDTLKVYGFIYNNVLKITGGDSIINGHINKIYYVKEKGWLRFESNSGEKWDRIN